MHSSARTLSLAFPEPTIQAILDYLRIIHELDPTFFDSLASGIAPNGRFFHDLLINQQRHPMDHCQLYFLPNRPVDFTPFKDSYLLIDKDSAAPGLLYVRSTQNAEVVIEDVKITSPVKFKETLARVCVGDTNPQIMGFETVQSLITANCNGHKPKLMIKGVLQQTPIDGFLGRLNAIGMSYDVNTIKELHRLRYDIYLEVFSATEGRKLLVNLTRRFSSSDEKIKHLITSLGFILTFALMNIIVLRKCMSPDKQDFINRVFNSHLDALATLHDLLNGDKSVLHRLFSAMDANVMEANAKFLRAHDEAAKQNAEAAMQQAENNARFFLRPLRNSLKELFTLRGENNLCGKREIFLALNKIGILHLNKKLEEFLDRINAVEIASTPSIALKKSLLASLAVIILECIKIDYSTIKTEELSLDLDVIKSIQNLISKADLYYKDNCNEIVNFGADLANDYGTKERNLVDKIRKDNQRRLKDERQQEKKEKKEEEKRDRKLKKSEAKKIIPEKEGEAKEKKEKHKKHKRHSISGFPHEELNKTGIQLNIPDSSRATPARQSSAGHTPPTSAAQKQIRRRASSTVEKEKPKSEPILFLRRGSVSTDPTPTSTSQASSARQEGTPGNDSPKDSPKMTRTLSQRVLERLRLFSKRPASPGSASRRNQEPSPLASAHPVHFQEPPAAASASSSTLPPESQEEIRRRKRCSARQQMFTELNRQNAKGKGPEPSSP